MTDVLAASAPPPRHQAAFGFIFITVLLDMMALGLIVPVLPRIVLGFMHGDTAAASHMLGLLGAFWASVQFLTMPVMGAFSDQFGRRPAILLSNFGLAIAYLLAAAAPNIAWLFASRILSGAAAASVSTANAYVADVTPPDHRAARFGLLGAAFGAGFVLGPAVGGLLGAIDLRLPYAVAAGFSVLNGLYGLFVLPESLPRERRSRFSWAKANPVGAFKFLSARPRILGLTAARFLEGMAQVVLPSTFVLYAGHRYGWDTRMVGITLGCVGVASVAVNIGLVRAIVARIGERRAMLTGLASAIVGFSIYGLAPVGWMFWCGIPFAAFWAMSGASGQAILTRQVGPTEQGQLQGALAAVVGVAGMIAPIVFTTVFAAGIEGRLGASVPGAPFLLAACLLSAAWLIARMATRAKSPP